MRRRKIAAGEELTADYALWEADESYVSPWTCQCGSSRCRGTITGKDWRQSELQRAYADHFSPLINKRIAAPRAEKRTLMNRRTVGVTKQQREWLNHLSDRDRIQIFPYDPESPKRFSKLKEKIQQHLGDSYTIMHRGSSSLGISGQGELDVYVPVAPKVFDETIEKLAAVFGRPKSNYPKQRARFVTAVDGTKAEVFVINNQSVDWHDGLQFESYLKSHPAYLERYRELKEQADGLNTRAYYRRKIEFINGVLALVRETDR